jgi:hypothetical protein
MAAHVTEGSSRAFSRASSADPLSKTSRRVRLASPPPPTRSSKDWKSQRVSYDPNRHCPYYNHKYGKIFEHDEASCTRKIRDASESIANKTGVLICAAAFAPEHTTSSLNKPIPWVTMAPEPVLSAYSWYISVSNGFKEVWVSCRPEVGDSQVNCCR